jgi:hypothetical protein
MTAHRQATMATMGVLTTPVVQAYSAGVVSAAGAPTSLTGVANSHSANNQGISINDPRHH